MVAWVSFEGHVVRPRHISKGGPVSRIHVNRHAGGMVIGGEGEA